jgi:hypothetical protein
MEEIMDKKGKWIKAGVFKSLVEPSKEYFKRVEQERMSELLNPEFKEPTVSNIEVQMANFILDITERLEKLEGGSM